MSGRDHDIVVVGATGFTGGLATEYLIRNAPPETRLALAARDTSRLEAVCQKLAGTGADREMAFVHAEMTDPAELRALAESARVVVSAVGPYVIHGEPLVEACANAGTDYIDLAGEPAFIDRMWLRYHERARETGARLIHSCGWTAVSHDLGALFAIEQLPSGEPVRLRCFVELSSTLSGGAYRSMLANIARPRQTVWSQLQRKRREQSPADRRVRVLNLPPLRTPEVRGFRVPYPTADRGTVLRSARALECYGPDFRYGYYLVFRRPNPLAAVKALGSYRKAGEGPTAEERERGWFKETFVGEARGQRVVARVSGGDPWYTEASKMLAESALCLAQDDLPETPGQVTPAVAMGESLTKRLRASGVVFEVLEEEL